MSVNFNLNNSSQRALDSAIMGCVRDAVQYLAEKHGFDAEAAFSDMNLNKTQPAKKVHAKKAKTVKASVPLPFCGVLLTSCCGVRVNHGLHSQCSNAKEICDISGNELDYCKTCGKQANENENSEPNAGDIRSRISGTWSPKGKLVNYGNVMDKLGITREKAEEEAAKLGLTIPEDQFIVVKGKRGRPKGADAAATSSSDDEKPKKPRGRPRKNAKVIDSSTGDDLIASLVAKADVESTASSESEQDEAKAAKSAEREEAKAARAAEKEAAKKAKEEAKAAKAAEKEATKAAKEEAKAAKAAEREAAKAAKAAEKEAVKAAKAAEKEAAKEDAKKVEELTAVENEAMEEVDKMMEELTVVENEAVEEQQLEEETEEDETDGDDEPGLEVSAIEIDDNMYLVDDDGNIYDKDTHEPTGQYYDAADKTIKLLE